MKAETIVKHFVLFIILIKIVYSIAYFSHIVLDNYDVFTSYFTSTNDTTIKMIDKDFTSDLDKHILFWKEKTEFIFTVCMSLLLIYHFFPDHNFIHNYKPIMVDKESKVLFLLFGFILLFSAKWTILFDDDSDFVRLIHLFR
jgi:hypothetical protein